MVDTIQGLIRRQIKDRSNDFKLELDCRESGDFFEIESQENTIIIRGNTQGNIAAGFYWYLKRYCHAHISWSEHRINLPVHLPKLNKKITMTSYVDYRYYFNFCTFSYSTAFWDWPRWEKEIDLMAMYGINMPLLTVGYEYLWIKVAIRLGLPESDVLSFLTGPAFAAWNHMGNIDGIGGPLTKQWIIEHYHLQVKILKRMRALGMNVVLPGFYGHVPKGLKRVFPKANIIQLDDWFGAKGTWFLEPTDPLYKKVATLFYEEQTKLYGNDHLYAMDLFHEGNIPNSKQGYLKETADSVINTLKAYDSDAIWVMQSWSMQKDIIQAIPDDNLLILDLNAEETPKWEETNAFYGKPWIWCMLHNYGGRHGMNGNIKAIVDNLNHALTSKTHGKLYGIGFAPEAIEENPILYELISERVWETIPSTIEAWVDDYIHRRYGQNHFAAHTAWKLLLKSVYAGNNSFGATDSIICARPDLTIDKVAVSGVESYYPLEDIMQAYAYMIDAAKDFNNNNGFTYDLVDIGRESLAMAARPIYLKMMNAYKNADKDAFMNFWRLLKDVILGLDALVGTHQHFLLGKYIKQAEAWGTCDREKHVYSYNLKMQITRWWPTVSFMDYANKHWAGLLKDYYLGRWEVFTKHLLLAMDKKIDFDQTAYINEIETFEAHFRHQKTHYKSTPDQLPLDVALHIYHTLYPKIKASLSRT